MTIRGGVYVYRETDDTFSYDDRYAYGDGDGIIDVGSGKITDSYAEIILNDDGTFIHTTYRTFTFSEIKIDIDTRKEYLKDKDKNDVYPPYLFYVTEDFKENKEFKSEWCEKGTWKETEGGFELTATKESLKFGTVYNEQKVNDAEPDLYLLETDENNKEYLIYSNHNDSKYYKQ